MRNLWFHSGDIGRIDDDGYLFFVDRKADYLRRRGENISSFEVETILVKHAAIADVVVHAVPSEITEDDLKITAVLVTDASVTEEELFRWCVDELPYFALPRYIEFRDELPRSPVGRVLKRELRDEGVTDVDLGPRGERRHATRSADGWRRGRGRPTVTGSGRRTSRFERDGSLAIVTVDRPRGPQRDDAGDVLRRPLRDRPRQRRSPTSSACCSPGPATSSSPAATSPVVATTTGASRSCSAWTWRPTRRSARRRSRSCAR